MFNLPDFLPLGIRYEILKYSHDLRVGSNFCHFYTYV